MRDCDLGRNGQWHPQYEQQKVEGMSHRYQYLDRLSTGLVQFFRIMTWLSAGIPSGMPSCVGTLDLCRSPEYCVKKSIKLMDRDGMTNQT